jgi:hypothetical protein
MDNEIIEWDEEDMDSDYVPPCDGHPSGPYDLMGETVYCDGSCNKK